MSILRPGGQHRRAFPRDHDRRGSRQRAEDGDEQRRAAHPVRLHPEHEADRRASGYRPRGLGRVRAARSGAATGGGTTGSGSFPFIAPTPNSLGAAGMRACCSIISVRSPRNC